MFAPKNYSVVNGIKFPHRLSDNRTYTIQAGLKGIALLKFWVKIFLGYRDANIRLKKTLRLGECYYGPFKGEMGHMLAHTLPFLMYLHKHGVKIHYCGLDLHKPFLVDEQRASILTSYVGLRDFFAEVPPSSNEVVPPPDVQSVIEKFEKQAAQSGLPFWNIGDSFYYWFIHRNWLGKGHTYLYDLSKAYKRMDEKSICIFPRSKGAKSSHNNGEPWDYIHLIDLLKPYVDKIYIVGHPSQSLAIPPTDKTEVRITSDNESIIEACSNSNLIITQHSGINNLGEYVGKQVLIIYKGGNKVEDIGSMNNTLRFRKFLREKLPLQFAFSEEQIVEYVKQLFAKWN
jgi:hypothetical protein